MRPLILIAALIFSIPSFGQDTLKQNTPRTEFKRLLFGVNISPDYCFRTLGNKYGGSTISYIIDLRDTTEIPKISFTAGLNICCNFSTHLGIEAGLQYSNKGYAGKNLELTFGDDPNSGSASNNSAGPVPTKVKFIYNYIYLDIPIRAIYSFGENRIHGVASFGVATNILIKATQTSILEYDNGDVKRQTSNQQENFNSLNISPFVSLGVDYRISNKINLRVEPTMRYGILTIIDAPITTNLWNAGLNISCYYQLK